MWRISRKLTPLLFTIPLVAALPATPSTHKLVPSSIQCVKLTKSYPVTIMSKLFSSVPKREFAIQEVSLTIGNKSKTNSCNKNDVMLSVDEIERNSFILLVGRSASGKTTLLKILAGDEKPSDGKVLLNGSNVYGGNLSLLPKPILIDAKPDCYDDKNTVVLERIKNAAGTTINGSSDFIEGLAEEFITILNLSPGQVKGIPSALSPSGQHLFGIACACMQSSCAAIEKIDIDSSEVRVPGPVLLLDELLDTETSSVAYKVGIGLNALVRRGGIVLAATHRPTYLTKCADRQITFSAGKVIMDELCA